MVACVRFVLPAFLAVALFAGSSAPIAATAPVRPDVGYTFQQADGNRFSPGPGRNSVPVAVDVPLERAPTWLVTASAQDDTVWVATLDNGEVEGFRLGGRTVRSVPVTPSRLPAQTPPLLLVDERGMPRLANVLADDASPATHPALLGRGSAGLAYLTIAGELVIRRGARRRVLAVGSLPDARILTDARGRLLVLGEPTRRYGHAVLGDGVEAAGIVLVETEPAARVARTIAIDPPAVVEGIAPIWSDLDGDGEPEIIVTVSDPREGARIVVYDDSGRRIASGPPMGTGFRWRHQLAVAPFGPGGELELAAVRTPHIGGVVEYYRLNGASLDLVATQHGYSTHRIGSRNLDVAVAVDWDGDGRTELLVPSRDFNEIVALRRTPGGVETLWRVPAGARLATNLALARLPDGAIVLGVGTTDQRLRLWVP